MAIILKNWQYSLPMFPYLVNTDRFERCFVFEKNCRYNLQSADQSDWNKLTGFTIGLGLHNAVHKDSIRLAWRYNAELDMIELCWYAYKDGWRIYNESDIWRVRLGMAVRVIIFCTNKEKGTYRILLNGTCKDVAPKYPKANKLGWLCFPYFGGNRKAPQKMNITRKSY